MWITNEFFENNTAVGSKGGSVLLLPLFALLQQKAPSPKLSVHHLHQNCKELKARKIPTMSDGEYFSDTPRTLLRWEEEENYQLPGLLSSVQFLMASQLMLCFFLVLHKQPCEAQASTMLHRSISRLG